MHNRLSIQQFPEVLEKLRPRLKAIAFNLTNNRAEQEDLVQEMQIFLWENKKKIKNKTLSYILRGCYLWGKDYLKQGKSIDSKKRGSVTVMSIYSINKGEEIAFNIPDRSPDPYKIVITEDLKKIIGKRMDSKLKETYELLLEEYTLGEIAEKLSLSYEAVRLRVRKIRRISRDFLRKKLVFSRSFFFL
ncbi:MAG: sigma-70 family RNA polymerase sigma factor [Candidatus Aerophobetes bacterium]|nr:sigma-70 family RNA polymerase sigma factor [Candidatus Aerophobetes bacterium]